jgi:copper homeostasis protein
MAARLLFCLVVPGRPYQPPLFPIRGPDALTRVALTLGYHKREIARIAPMAKFLEVIVTSVEDALEAEAGGADRLELVRALEVGGLTPELDVVRAVLQTVKIPVRVMLRETPSMSAGTAADCQLLLSHARTFAELPIDGVVAGFIREQQLDLDAMDELFRVAANCRVTFHRAFDELVDPLGSIQQLKRSSQVDRILTSGGEGNWTERRRLLINWQHVANRSIKLLVGAGLCRSVLLDLGRTPELHEVHVGRAARLPQSFAGRVDREAVQSLKSALQ